MVGAQVSDERLRGRCVVKLVWRELMREGSLKPWLRHGVGGAAKPEQVCAVGREGR